MTLQFWFEFGSTYSYPAAMRIEATARSRDLAISWEPFLLGPIFREQGWNDSPFNLYPAKGAYMWRDLERTCEAEGIPHRRPSVFPRNGLLAARVVCAAAGAPWVPAFVRAVYTANFAEDLDISAPSVVASCLAGVGQDPAALLESAASEAVKHRLRERTECARQLGLFGAPSFVVGHELFWGNDRLEQAVDYATR